MVRAQSVLTYPKPISNMAMRPTGTLKRLVWPCPPIQLNYVVCHARTARLKRNAQYSSSARRTLNTLPDPKRGRLRALSLSQTFRTARTPIPQNCAARPAGAVENRGGTVMENKSRRFAGSFRPIYGKTPGVTNFLA